MNFDIFADFVEPVKAFSKTQKGAPLMIDQKNFTYLKVKVSEKSHRIYWRCQMSRSTENCKARATTLFNKIVAFTFEHNHEPFSGSLDRELREDLLKE